MCGCRNNEAGYVPQEKGDKDRIKVTRKKIVKKRASLMILFKCDWCIFYG